MVFRQYHSPCESLDRERQLITTLVVLLIVLATFQILADLTEVLSRVADVLISSSPRGRSRICFRRW